MSEQHENETQDEPKIAQRSAGHLLALTSEAALLGGAARIGGLAAKDAYDKIKDMTHKEPPSPPPSDDDDLRIY
jgi:hypothetical protein